VDEHGVVVDEEEEVVEDDTTRDEVVIEDVAELEGSEEGKDTLKL